MKNRIKANVNQISGVFVMVFSRFIPMVSRRLCAAVIFLVGAATLFAGPQTIFSGMAWNDQNGINVQGHGGNIIKVGSTFYWFGENKTNENASDAYFQSVRCYSSTDLAHWTLLADALTRQAGGDLGPDRIVERPKVIYNDATGKYVMYMHIDTPGYGTGKVGVATSVSVSGPYTYLGSFKPLGLQSWDMNLFKDDDGTAYLLTHAGDGHLHIDRLSADYLSVVSSVAALQPNYEAPAIFKWDGHYYLFGSELTGWNSNDNKYTTATNLAGPWSNWNLFAPAGSETFNSQTACILPVTGSRETTIMFMGDRWNSSDLGASTYVWLPLRVTDTNVWLLGYTNGWNLDPDTGSWTGNGSAPPEPPVTRPSLADGKIASADSWQSEHPASFGNDGNITTRWCANDGYPGHWWKVDLGGIYNLSGTEVNWETSGAYQYRIDVSSDNVNWTNVVDKTANTVPAGLMDDTFSASARYVRITVTGLPSGLWTSFYEFRVFSVIPKVLTTHAGLSGTTLMITAQSNSPGDLCHLLRSTNLSLPFSLWTPVLTNSFDNSGKVSFLTDITKLSHSHEFYVLQL